MYEFECSRNTCNFVRCNFVLRALCDTTYDAIWAGVGTVLTTAIGIIIWDEAFGFIKAIAFALSIIGVILLSVPGNIE